MRKYNISIIVFPLIAWQFSGCGSTDGVPYFSRASTSAAQQIKIDAIKNLPAGKLSIVQVDALMALPGYDESSRPKLYSRDMNNINDTSLFESTPTGSYISHWVNGRDNASKIEEASYKMLEQIGTAPLCKTRCSQEFQEDFITNRGALESRLVDLTKTVINNEISNAKIFCPCIMAFPMSFDFIKIHFVC